MPRRGENQTEVIAPGWGWRITILFTVGYEALILTSATIAGFPGGAVSPVPHGIGILPLGLACAFASISLFFVPRFPREAPIACCMLYAVVAALGYGGFLGIPVMVAIYALGRYTPIASTAAWAALILVTVGSALGAPGSRLFEALTSAVSFAMPLILGIAMRSRAESARARERELLERTRADMIATQRDQALSQARIAAELHDSVGHGLTTIIALSEGLKASSTNDPLAAEALLGINEVARECLTQTRQAVTALAPYTAMENSAVIFGDPHHWEDVETVLTHAREAGVACTLAETGRRPTDIAQADLAFRITRESITNALRHAEPSTIAVSWEHRADGCLALSISNDGLRANRSFSLRKNSVSTPGSGLARLNRCVHDAGGAFSAGISEGMWLVEAHIPALQAYHEDEGKHP